MDYERDSHPIANPDRNPFIARLLWEIEQLIDIKRACHRNESSLSYRETEFSLESRIALDELRVALSVYSIESM